jgi:hypothetical protein
MYMVERSGSVASGSPGSVDALVRDDEEQNRRITTDLGSHSILTFSVSGFDTNGADQINVDFHNVTVGWDTTDICGVKINNPKIF